MEYDLMNVGYDLVNGEVRAWRISRDGAVSDGMFYVDDSMHLCVEANGRNLEEIKTRMTKLISQLGGNCSILAEGLATWGTFEELEANWKVSRLI